MKESRRHLLLRAWHTPAMDRLADFRNVFAQIVMARAGSADPRLLRAFAVVPRHEFIGPSPWQFTEHGLPAVSDDAALLYQDVVMGLAPARGLTTGSRRSRSYSLSGEPLARCRPLAPRARCSIGAAPMWQSRSAHPVGGGREEPHAS